MNEALKITTTPKTPKARPVKLCAKYRSSARLIHLRLDHGCNATLAAAVARYSEALERPVAESVVVRRALALLDEHLGRTEGVSVGELDVLRRYAR